MTAKKLFVLVLSALFLFGSAGPVAAQEKKMEEKKAADTTSAPGKAVGKSKNANGTVKAATA